MAAPQPNVVEALNQVRAQTQTLFRQLLRTRQKVAALEALAALQREGRTPHMPVEFRSQYAEDMYLWDLFDHQPEGFFIEVGAFDGYEFSVTYALESLGWSGLLIEAIPERAEQCRARRPHSRVINAALSRRGAKPTAEFVITTDHHAGMLSHLKEHADAATANLPKTTISIPALTMNDVLKDHAGPIDLAVIDVEGGELDVLDGFDLYRHKPRVLLLEDNTLGRDARLGNYMASMPYVLVGWVQVNRVYIRADLTDLQARAAHLV